MTIQTQETYTEKRKNEDATTYELADVGTRFIALVIDSLIVGAIVGIALNRNAVAWGGINFVVGLLYQWYFLTRNNGQTPGKMLLKIRVVKASGAPLETADVILRHIGYYLNSVIVGLGWLWAFFDKDHQGWHDKLARTYVVRAE